MILQVIALAVVLVAVQVQTVQDKKKRKALSVSERLKSKHRQSAFDQSWIKEYKWLESVKEKDKISGMKCSLCEKHGKSPRNGKGSWMTVPCYTLRNGKIKKHTISSMHKAAQIAQAESQCNVK